jgi:dihydrofolate reductase
MTRLVADLSMSLDGFITGPASSVERPLGMDDGRLHDWMFDARTDVDAEVCDQIYSATGAVLMGRRMFDVGVEPWGDPPPFGMPVVVVTHRPRDPLPMSGGTTYTFVTDGIAAALASARKAAGGKDVGLWGGASLCQQYLEADLVDELYVHLVPVLLGDGVRLFDGRAHRRVELTKKQTLDSPRATHLLFEVVRRRGPSTGLPAPATPP